MGCSIVSYCKHSLKHCLFKLTLTCIYWNLWPSELSWKGTMYTCFACTMMLWRTRSLVETDSFLNFFKLCIVFNNSVLYFTQSNVSILKDRVRSSCCWKNVGVLSWSSGGLVTLQRGNICSKRIHAVKTVMDVHPVSFILANCCFKNKYRFKNLYTVKFK